MQVSEPIELRAKNGVQHTRLCAGIPWSSPACCSDHVVNYASAANDSLRLEAYCIIRDGKALGTLKKTCLHC